MDVSLADIIKKKKISKFQNRNGNTRVPNKRGPFKQPPRMNVKDARIKIIQKNRRKLVDARDKLAQLAKKTDARLKLQKMRKQNKFSTFPKQSQTIGNSRFSLSTAKNGQISLSSKKDFVRKPVILQRSVKNDYICPDLPLTMTVVNSAPLSRMPPLPDIGKRPSFWESSDYRDVRSQKVHSIIPKDLKMKITVNQNVPINRNIIDSPMMDVDYDDIVVPQKMSNYAPASYGSSHRSLREPSPPLDVTWNRTSPGWRPQHRVLRSDTIDLTDSIHSRLDVSPTPVRTMGILSAEGGGDYSRNTSSRSLTRSQPQPRTTQSYNTPQGYRIVVSNLQANVTKEDIKELFEDVGELLESRLVRPGTAEVIFKTLADAQQAVDVYHNRQLDGQPMKCLLVIPRQGNKPTAPALKPSSPHVIRTAYNGSKKTKNIAEPDLDAFHTAMFMRR